MVLPTTSALHTVNNDTGRTAYCGPYVVSAVTGYSISRIEDEIRRARGMPAGSERVVEGTYTEEVAAALRVFGYRMDLVAQFMDLERKERPTLWTWMQKPRNAWAHYILGVHKGRVGHWILVKGAKLCDTYTDGKWTFVVDSPHKGARLMEVHAVRKDLGV
ncbi:MAG: hypothetical protein KDJ41_20760 [Hyphomicrobiaceae bacterium]|nr:hypothetical protein [Hyphomicrobiaceae bacterium]